MKKKSASQSAFFNLRLLTGVVLSPDRRLSGADRLWQFSAQAQSKNNAATKSMDPLVPAGFDCAQIRALGIDMQENLRAGALMIFCGEAIGGSAYCCRRILGFAQQLLAPLLGGTDVDLITGTETSPNITQSETFSTANPDNPNEIRRRLQRLARPQQKPDQYLRRVGLYRRRHHLHPPHQGQRSKPLPKYAGRPR